MMKSEVEIRLAIKKNSTMKINKLQYAYILMHPILFGSMIYLGFSFAMMEEQLWEGFWAVGWENYRGPDVDYPSNTFHTIFIVLFGISLMLEKLQFKTGEITRTLKFWTYSKYLSLAFSIAARLVDGDWNVRETTAIWMGICAIQFLFPLVWYKQLRDRTEAVNSTKPVWLAHTLAYIGILGAGFYFWYWDAEIVAARRALGDAYNGVDKDLPENTYFMVMIIASVGSVLTYLLHKPINSSVQKTFVALVVILFGSSFFMYANDGNPDMGETAWAWISLCSLMIVGSIILYRIAPQVSDYTDLLDDGLELMIDEEKL